jgi:hypothetical protein
MQMLPGTCLSHKTTDAWDWGGAYVRPDSYAGQTVTLYVGAKKDGDDDTAALYVDAVQVEVCVASGCGYFS